KPSDLEKRLELLQLWVRKAGLPPLVRSNNSSSNTVGCFGLSEEVFAGLFGYETGVFEFEIRALNLTFVDGEFLRQHRRRRQRLSRSNSLAVNLLFNLLA